MESNIYKILIFKNLLLDEEHIVVFALCVIKAILRPISGKEQLATPIREIFSEREEENKMVENNIKDIVY